MIPFERALVSSYRPSMQGLHSNFSYIFTRFRDIAVFVHQHATFAHPTSIVSPKISPCSPGIGWMAFGLLRAKVLGELSVQLVSKISNLCGPDAPTSQTDGQTDDMRSQDVLCTMVHRAVTMQKEQSLQLH